MQGGSRRFEDSHGLYKFRRRRIILRLPADRVTHGDFQTRVFILDDFLWEFIDVREVIFISVARELCIVFVLGMPEIEVVIEERVLFPAEN